MKKLLLTLAAGLLAWTASAQSWNLGGRVGSGFEVVGQYEFSNANYVEGRLGASFLDGVGFEFSALYNWNIANMDWTPKAGTWFFDLGAGANVGFGNYFHIGPQGVAKLGIAFRGAPVKLSVDWSPTFGIYTHNSTTSFYGPGLAGFGITCVYCF